MGLGFDFNSHMQNAYVSTTTARAPEVGPTGEDYDAWVEWNQSDPTHENTDFMTWYKAGGRVGVELEWEITDWFKNSVEKGNYMYSTAKLVVKSGGNNSNASEYYTQDVAKWIVNKINIRDPNLDNDLEEALIGLQVAGSGIAFWAGVALPAVEGAPFTIPFVLTAGATAVNSVLYWDYINDYKAIQEPTHKDNLRFWVNTGLLFIGPSKLGGPVSATYMIFDYYINH